MTSIHLDELERYPDMSGAPVLLPVRRALGIRAFGVNCWTAPVGQAVIERHSEPNGEEELYLVVRGRARFTVGDEETEADAGTLVFVQPDTVREAIATAPETVVLAVGAKPGEAFEAKHWEDFQVAFAQARAGSEDEGRALVTETVERAPNAWQGWYNAASFETLTGNPDRAFEHLSRAVELGPPEVRTLAAEGDDFASLHSDPRWKELVG